MLFLRLYYLILHSFDAVGSIVVKLVFYMGECVVGFNLIIHRRSDGPLGRADRGIATNHTDYNVAATTGFIFLDVVYLREPDR